MVIFLRNEYIVIDSQYLCEKGTRKIENLTFEFPSIQKNSRLERKGVQKDEKSQNTYR